MTARDEASGYMEDAFQNNNEASWEQLLDAIPAGVLARLAIERGGLIPAEDLYDYHLFPVKDCYRVVEP